MKIYTRGGDQGETSLFGGKRVRKNTPRVSAYGDVDELNAALGCSLASIKIGDLRDEIENIQRDLFALQAQLADPRYDPAKAKEKTRLTEERIAALEAWIDRCMEEVGPLKNFVLPGGTSGASLLHLARTICRRAERSVLSLSESEAVPPIVVKYLNRLSDLLFAVALVENKRAGVESKPW